MRSTFKVLFYLKKNNLKPDSQMLGHSNIHTTQIYAKITNEKISRDMAALTDRIGDKYQVETNRPKSDFRNIGKVGKRKKSML